MKRIHEFGPTRSPFRCPKWLLPALGAAGLACADAPPPDPAELLTARTVGLAYLEENRLDDAVAEFTRLTEMAPDEPLGHANLGIAFLRQGRLEEAERSVRRALDMEAGSDALLILAEVLLADGRPEAARDALRDALDADSANARVLYALAELDADSTGSTPLARRAATLDLLVAIVPGNVAAHVERLTALLAAGRTEDGAAALEAVRQLEPEFPVEAGDPFDAALLAADRGDAESALAQALAFRNVMRTTPSYQGGLIELRGPGGVLVGFPVVTFSQALGETAVEQSVVLAAIRFTDVSESFGLVSPTSGEAGAGPGNGPASGIVAVADFDSDGDRDVYVGGRLLEDRAEGFIDVTEERGLGAVTAPLAATFADYDNDGHLDLYVAAAGGGHLFHNPGDGGPFAEVTAELGVVLPAGEPLFADLDHDGDLDLALSWTGGGALLRNNLDGSFTHAGDRAGFPNPDGPGGAEPTGTAAFGDFDDDDDLDLVVPDPSGPIRLHDNRRLGLFAEIAAERGLEAGDGSRLVVSGDYNNDGWLDLLAVGGDGPGVSLFLNDGNGSFDQDLRPSAFLSDAGRLTVHAAAFLDFDNDGWLDVVVAGESGDGSGAVALYRNAAAGRFDLMEDVIPAVPAVHGLVASDFGDDGDLDLFLGLADGGVRLLRNDGGSANRFLKLGLVGLSTGSGKNNHFGIGAKVEVRAGGLYQSRTVTGPELHFGLGRHARADVVRIRWTNGVPQNLFYPGANQSVVEEQILKGSCPFLYAWDGERFSMVTDLMWKSALGMPMGLMAQGDQAFAPPGASREYLRIPAESLRERDGTYELRVTGELWEVFYLDEVELLAVDHPDSVDVFVDERFAFVTGEVPLDIRQVSTRRGLLAATDHHGRDVLAELAVADDRYVADFIPERHQGVSRLHHLTLDLGQVPEDDAVTLYLRGWIFPTDASINVALSQSGQLEAVMPYLQVPDPDGGWRTVVPMFSFPAGKDKTVIQDLTGLLTPGDHRVRIGTTMNIYWDEAFVTVGEPNAPVNVTRMESVSAELRYHGVAEPYHRGGADGPHWFDYGAANPVSPWRPIVGNLTRYGDVTGLLIDADSRYPILGPGDEIALSFSEEGAPPVPEGWRRDFLIYTVGWLKDADLSTAEGWRVGPLPFHGMSAYPYGQRESYPFPDLVDTLHTRVPSPYPSLAEGSDREPPRGGSRP